MTRSLKSILNYTPSRARAGDSRPSKDTTRDTRTNRTVSKPRQAGFTIVELLIVIVVIGILAAISIVSYNGIQARAAMTKKETVINNAHKQFELHRVEFNSYPDTYDFNSRTVDMTALEHTNIDTNGFEIDPLSYITAGGTPLYNITGHTFKKDTVYVSSNTNTNIYTGNKTTLVTFLYWDDKESTWTKRGEELYYNATSGSYTTDSWQRTIQTKSNGQPEDPQPY